MNLMFKSHCFGFKSLSYFKSRQFSEVINFSRYTKSINDIEHDAKKNIDIAFAKESITPVKVHKLLDDVPIIMSQTYNYLMKSLIDKIWEEVNKKNVKVDISHYNKTMEMYLMNDIEFNPLDILRDVNKNKISYNNITFDLLLKKFCQLGDYPSAVKLIDKMVQSHMFINGTKNAWLIACAIRANKEEEVGRYYEEVKSKNLIFTHATYAFIAEAYASKMEVDKCIAMHKEAASIIGDHPKSLQYQYRSYFELARNNADEEHLAKILNYIDHKNNVEAFTLIFKRLCKSKLFSAAEFLVKNSKIPLNQDNYEFLAKWWAPLKPPLENMRFLLSKSNNPSFQLNIIRFVTPFEEAFKMAENLLNEFGIQFLRRVLSNIMFNATNSPNTVPKMKFILNFFDMKFQEIDFNTSLISGGIDNLLSLHPDDSYSGLLSTFANTDDNKYTMRLVACCVLHALCKGHLDSVTRLTDQYPDCMKHNLSFYNRDIGFLLVRNKSLDDLCGRIEVAKAVLPGDQYKYLMASVLHQFALIHSVEELNPFLHKYKADFPNPMRDLDFIKESQKLSTEKLNILRNFQNEDGEMSLP